MNFWWCNQGGPWWEGERKAGLVCAEGDPTQDTRGDTNRKTVGEAKAGDIILHYRKQEHAVVAFSRAKEDGKSFRRLPKVSGESYGSGWCFHTEYHDLNIPIKKLDFVEVLIPHIVTGYPINRDGNVNQGYFFRFHQEDTRTILSHVTEPIPSWLARFRDPALTQTRYRALSRKQVESELEDEIEASRSLSETERNKKLAAAPKMPERIQIISTGFRRNPHVIVTVLLRAKGICEKCGAKGPFKKRLDGSPYLEVHHWKPLSQDGEDSVENAAALCPTATAKSTTLSAV